jgi:hypothetical protein
VLAVPQAPHAPAYVAIDRSSPAAARLDTRVHIEGHAGPCIGDGSDHAPPPRFPLVSRSNLDGHELTEDYRLATAN